MVFRVLAGQAPASNAPTYGVQVLGVLLFIFQGTSGEVVSIAPVLMIFVLLQDYRKAARPLTNGNMLPKRIQKLSF